MVVTRTHLGYVKRTPRTRVPGAGPRRPRHHRAPASADGDFVADMFAASTHDHLLLFTDKGRVYDKKVFELPEGARTAKGRAVVNVLELQEGEQVVAMLPFKEFRDGHERVLRDAVAARSRRPSCAQFENVRASGIMAITIDEGDRLVGAALVTEGR